MALAWRWTWTILDTHNSLHGPVMKRPLTLMLALMVSSPCISAPTPSDGCMPADYLIFFDARSSVIAGPLVAPHLAERASRLLDRVAVGWSRVHGRIVIEGHEDGAERLGGGSYGAARAETLRAALVARGVDPTAIDVRDLAANAPLVPTTPDADEQQNRFSKVRLADAAASCVKGPS